MQRCQKDECMLETALSQPQITRDDGTRHGVYRGQQGCASLSGTFGRVPGTPLSGTFVPRTGGFASLPCGRFALIKNLSSVIVTS